MVFAVICLITLCVLIYAVLKWLVKDCKLRLSTWRRVAFGTGFCLVIFQALLFVTSWSRDVSDYVSFARWARWVLPSFVAAASCVLTGKGASRWLFLAVSVLLFGLCFLIVLSA